MNISINKTTVNGAQLSNEYRANTSGDSGNSCESGASGESGDFGESGDSGETGNSGAECLYICVCTNIFGHSLVSVLECKT